MLKTLILADQKTISPLIEILDWITAKGYNCEIKSFEELFFDNRFSVWIGDKSKEGIPLSKHFYSVWFRRDEAFSAEGNPIVLESTKGNLNYNFKILQKLFSCFARKHLKVLSSYDSFFLNKLLVLDMAFDLGLDVPQTFLCNNKQKLSMFISKYDSVICKSSGENLSIIFNKKNVLKQYVVEIDEKILKDLPDKFFPTLFQQRIDKQMDIRIFYIDGKFFPMAIFSQCLDFREDYHNHRNVPIKLPADLEKKLHQLMQKLNLNTGSIDMVRCAKTNKYYFLEVNPNGQFGMVSKPCNYYLEREIAEFLTT